MKYKKCEVSKEGFVIPNFDFGSEDAVLPVSVFTPYVFNITDHFVNLVESIEKGDIQQISRSLSLFKASVIDNPNDLPELLFKEYSVPEILMTLIDPYNYFSILYESLCAAIAWTGCQDTDSDKFNDENFIYFLIETSVHALSDRDFPGDKKIGRAAIGLLRNLLNNSDDIRISFINMDGIKLFSSLFLEITDKSIRDYILWILQNSFNVSAEPPYELLKEVETVLRSSFRFYMSGVERSEIRLAIAYAKCGPDFAISLMKNVEFDTASVYFVYAPPDTQVEILELFETLLFYPDEEVVNTATEKIKWNDFMPQIPNLMDKYVSKKFISLAAHFFNENPKPILNTRIVETLVQIFRTSKYSIKLKVIDCLSILLKQDTSSSSDSILFNNVIDQVVLLLDEKNTQILKFALQMLLHIIKIAERNDSFLKLVITKFDESEFGPIIEEFCSEEQKPEIAELADIVRNEYEIISDAYDEIQADSPQNEFYYAQGFGEMPPGPINYEELSKNHQSSNFQNFPFASNDGEEEGFNEPYPPESENRFGNDDNEGAFRSGFVEDGNNDDDEEEEKWYDVEDDDFDDEFNE